MDNKKIGKLIAKLRNEQGLTQQELGDKIGVGFRAVSKWERGLTLPDISNINELSKILGISSDELLSGELKENPNKEQNKKNKLSLKVKIIISIITILILIITLSINHYKNKTYIYEMVSMKENEYHVEGYVTFQDNNISIILNQLKFKDITISTTTISNYQYDVFSSESFIFGYGMHHEGNIIDNKRQTIKDFADTFKINYNGKLDINKSEILKNNIKIKLTMLDLDKNEIIKEIDISLHK